MRDQKSAAKQFSLEWIDKGYEKVLASGEKGHSESDEKGQSESK